ncbi:hypothetical protein JCM19241_3967 [Vibrio ishigakensis]|uniref:Uncharacterized protein n=1 Tax=Vibrio ishigakensis TaxID=1481914 RepID=A0A0B8Q9T4_9VIBR|nr:hypothetical protein JCM19241_3967 [Vibrio ishigakensis]
MYDELSQIAPTYMFQIDNKDYWKTTQAHWQTLGDIFNQEQKVAEFIQITDAASHRFTNQRKRKICVP